MSPPTCSATTFLAGLGLSGDVTPYLLDADGAYLSHPDESKRFGVLLQSGQSFVADFGDGTASRVLGATNDLRAGGQMFAHTTVALDGYVTDNNWTLVTQVDSASLAVPGIAKPLLVGALVLLVGVAGAFMFARRIVAPLKRMAAAASAIASGDVDQDVSSDRRDEVGQMADAFGEMIVYLKEMAGASQHVVEDDLTVKITPRSENDALGNSLATMVINLRSLLGGIEARSAELEAANGELLKRLVAIEHTKDTIAVVDAEAGILYVNPAFETVTGYSSAEAVGRNMKMLNRGLQPPELYENLWSTIRGGETWRGRLVNRRKDGTLFTKDTSISPVLSDFGETLGYVAGKRDVTRQLAFEKSLAETQRMDAIGTLAGGIAHDFNNILTVVIGSAQMIASETKEGDTASELAGEIVDAGTKGATLVRQLLAFSRGQPLEQGEFDVSVAVDETTSMLSRIIGGSITVTTEVDDGVPQVGMGRSQFDHILTNLVMNARDAVPDGGAINVELSAVDLDDEPQSKWVFESGPYVRLRVADTGLGLSTIHGIVTQAGGDIEVETEPGAGTTFTVYLPAA